MKSNDLDNARHFAFILTSLLACVFFTAWRLCRMETFTTWHGTWSSPCVECHSQKEQFGGTSDRHLAKGLDAGTAKVDKKNSKRSYGVQFYRLGYVYLAQFVNDPKYSVCRRQNLSNP